MTDLAAIVRLSRAVSIEEQPDVSLENWRIRECEDASGNNGLHFFGTINGRGRVSSPIIEWDVSTMSGRTSSGRVYALSGSRGEMTIESEAIFMVWCQSHGIVSVRDWSDALTREAQRPERPGMH